MARRSLAARGDRIRAEFEGALLENHRPDDVAASFAIGVFVTTLPTLGAGLLVFVAIASLSDRVSKLALVASVVVLNPVAKWGVYGASFWVGTLLVGPVPGDRLAAVSLSDGPDIALRLLVGNLLLAVVFTIAGYVVALRLAREIHSRQFAVDDLLSDAVRD